MPRYEIEFVAKGTVEIDAPSKEYAHDIFHDSDNYDFKDAGDVEIVRIEEQPDYGE